MTTYAVESGIDRALNSNLPFADAGHGAALGLCISGLRDRMCPVIALYHMRAFLRECPALVGMCAAAVGRSDFARWYPIIARRSENTPCEIM